MRMYARICVWVCVIKSNRLVLFSTPGSALVHVGCGTGTLGMPPGAPLDTHLRSRTPPANSTRTWASGLRGATSLPAFQVSKAIVQKA